MICCELTFYKATFKKKKNPLTTLQHLMLRPCLNMTEPTQRVVCQKNKK